MTVNQNAAVVGAFVADALSLLVENVMAAIPEVWISQMTAAERINAWLAQW